MKFSAGRVRASTSIAAGIVVGALLWMTAPAYAALTFSGASISGDSGIVIDSTSTISIGTSSASGIRIGNPNASITISGPVTISATTTMQNLTAGGFTISGLISSSTQCLHVNAAGLVSGTGSDCGSGSSGGSSTVNSSLSSFFDGNVASETVAVFGNSTVWNATTWFATIYQDATLSGGVFGGMDVHSDVTSISADGSGNVTVTLNSSASDLAVGKFVTLIPTSGAINCDGTGVVSAVSGNQFTFNIANSGSCANISGTASTGYATEQILNFGNNGATLAAMLANNSATSTGIGGICAMQPNLLIIRGPLINDMRLGLTTQAQAEVLEQQLLNAVRSCSPNTSIYLKTENSLLSTNTSGQVSPNSSAQAYSAILEAVPMSFTNVYPNVVTADMQKLLYGTTALPLSSAPYMSDQLHPNGTGQTAEANMDIEILTTLSNHPFQEIGNVDPNSATTLIPFSPFLAAAARANNYAQPWLTYPYACADPRYYTLVASGNAAGFSAGQTFFRMSYTGSSSVQINPFDVVEQQTAGCWQLTGSPSSAQQNPGVTQIGLSGGQTTPYAMVSGEQISIWRPMYPNVASQGYLGNPVAFPYARRVYVPDGGSGFFDIVLMPSENFIAGMSSINTSDILLSSASSSPISLSICSPLAVQNNAELRCLASGNFSSIGGSFGWVVGTQAKEGTPDPSGNLIVTGSEAVGYRFGTTTNSMFNVASSTGIYFTVQNGGNIGLGTPNPSSTLHVLGNIQLSGSSTVITPSIGGSALAPGQCSSATSSIDSTVASSTAAFVTTPESYPGDGIFWGSYLFGSGILTTKVCAVTSTTPTATPYNVKILK